MQSEKYHTQDLDQDSSILKGVPVICLFWSGGWCPPCRKFLPKLIDFYKQANESDRKVEIIFCSQDKNKECFDEYFSQMPWIAHPYTPKVLQEIGDQYGVSKLPTLLVMNQDATVCIKDGKSEVEAKGAACVDEWIPKVH